ncbi:heme exporter protein CcmD [Proteobacteria bacterium 005FR1]|nr:heme exporter protein CcmD [Proteobacteria bacterium 005FR1]
MDFQFESFGEFLAMNGHGAYVWACFAVTFALMLYLAFAPDIRVRQFIRQQKRLERRMAAARSGELESG